MAVGRGKRHTLALLVGLHLLLSEAKVFAFVDMQVNLLADMGYDGSSLRYLVSSATRA